MQCIDPSFSFFIFVQAGDKHYHPSCARCSRCNQMFTEGEEMYLQGKDDSIPKQGDQTWSFFCHRPQDFTNCKHRQGGLHSHPVFITVFSDFWDPFTLMGAPNGGFAEADSVLKRCVAKMKLIGLPLSLASHSVAHRLIYGIPDWILLISFSALLDHTPNCKRQ